MQYQYHHRSRLPPPPPSPPPFGRGNKQLYAPPTPPPSLLAPPHRRYEVLMEAGRLAAEYLVSTGVLPPSSLQRDPWAVPPPPPPPPQPRPAFYDWRRYDDGTRPRRNSSITTSCSTKRDGYSNGGGYNGRWKRKYGEYRMGYSDCARERGRSNFNGRRYEEEDKDEDGAPGFRRARPSSVVDNDESRTCVADEVKEATSLMDKEVKEARPLMDKALVHMETMEDTRSNADALLESQAEMKENTTPSSELQMDTNGDANNTSIVLVMEAEAKLLLDGKVVGEKAEEKNDVLCDPSLDRIALHDDMKNLGNGLHVSLLKNCGFAKPPTKLRSVRAHRKALTETVDLISSGEESQMVADEAANERSLTNIQSDNREEQINQANTLSSTAYNETMGPMHLQETKTLVVTGSMREDMNDAQLHVVQEYKEEPDVSSLTTSQKDNLIQENDLSLLSASRKDGLMEETNLYTLIETHKDSMIEDANLSPLTDTHNDSLIEETSLSPLADVHNDSLIEESDQSPSTASHKVTMMQDTDLTQAIYLHKNNLNLQCKEGAKICDTEIVPKDVDLVELSDEGNTVGSELFSNAGAETIIQMEDEKLDQSSSFRTHNNPDLGQCSAQGYSVEPHKQLQKDFGASAGDIISGTNELCQVSLDNNSIQVFDIQDDMAIEDAGFDPSKAKSEMICSSMVGMMHPGIHTDDLPVIQDSYNFALSDYLASDVPCYTSLQPDLQAGICTNDSEGIHVMDDPIYGSLTDIGFMDVWNQPAEDFEKFF